MGTILTGALLVCAAIFTAVSFGLFKVGGAQKPLPPLVEEHSSRMLGAYAERGDWEGLTRKLQTLSLRPSGAATFYPTSGPPISLAGPLIKCRRLADRVQQLRHWVHEMGPDTVIRAIPAIDARGRIIGVLMLRMPGGPNFMDREKPYFMGSWYVSCALAGLLVCWLSMSQGRRLSTQLERFTVAAVQLSEGRRPRVEVPVIPSELAQLAHAFNSMACQLEDRLRSLQQARDDAQAADQMRRDFMAEIAHSLGTPLSAVQLGLAELRRNVPTTQKDRVIELEARLDWLGQTTRRLLKLACWEVVQPEIHPAPVALIEPIVNTLESLENKLLDADIHVILGRTLGYKVFADEDALRNIFTALLENCAQHSGGHCTLLIEASLTPDERVEVLVADTGVGMTEDTRRKAGERYFTQGRTGLGLAIAKRLLAAHHADLTIESTLGQGTSFRFTLPTERTNYD